MPEFCDAHLASRVWRVSPRLRCDSTHHPRVDGTIEISCDGAIKAIHKLIAGRVIPEVAMRESGEDEDVPHESQFARLVGH